MIYNSLIVLLGIALLVLVINLPVHDLLKFILGAACMYAVARLLSKTSGIKDEWGMLMVRSNAGLRTIEKLAKNAGFWNFFADTGVAVAYGLMAFFIIKGDLRRRAAATAAGLALLTVLTFIVAPFVFPFILVTIGSEGLASKSAMGQGFALLAAGLLYIGGFALMVFASLLGYAATILSAVIGTVFLNTGEIEHVAPGATLILPGINIPFAEGVIALALILAVHEGAHAVLARVAKIRILSSGIVLFGIVPVGAFVEPDEKELARKDAERQTRVLVAGSTANLAVALMVFALFAAFTGVTEQYKEGGLLIAGGNHSGEVIYYIEGQNAAEFVLNADGSQYNRTLTFETSAGTYEMRVGEGKLAYYNLSATQFIAKYSNPALQFIYTLLGLAFSLNFVIGVVNLLPLPLFDGYRLLELNVGKKEVVTAIAWIAALAFLVNFLPWVV